MKSTGKLISATRDIVSGRMNLTFALDTIPTDEINKLASYDLLDIEVGKYEEKRSLSANAYFHTLLGQMAKVLVISNARMKNILISKYGQVQFLPDGEVMIYKTNAPIDYMLELETIHCIPVKYGEENGKEVYFYKIYRGSHTYSVSEMSALIEGTCADARDLGISTMTPKELERLVSKWHPKAS